MRPVRFIVKALVFPVACIACLVWIAVFVLIYKMTPHNVGFTMLLVLSGAVLLFPWMTFVLAIMKRSQAPGSPIDVPLEPRADPTAPDPAVDAADAERLLRP